jgi:hypothetical protein
MFQRGRQRGPRSARFIVWCKARQHQVEPDPAKQTERYDAEMPVTEWHKRLACSKCGSREIDMVVTGTERRRDASVSDFTSFGYSRMRSPGSLKREFVSIRIFCCTSLPIRHNLYL